MDSSEACRGTPTGSLRELALRSGAYLLGREAVGVVVRLAGLVLVMRQIGPADFGLYSAAAAYVLFPTTLAQLGAEVFLIRQPGPLSRRTYDEVFTTLALASGIVVAGGMALSFLVAPWLRPFGVIAPMRVLLFSIPINILWAPFQACIERRFAYRRMGFLELGGDVALYATAVPLALMGYGAWSLVAGFFAWQSWLLFGSIALSGLRPRLAWSSATALALVAHGRTYALTTWIQGVRATAITMIVGTFAGATGVGLVNFAQRLVATMNFADRGVHRVGMVAISQANKDRPERLAGGLEEGTLLLMVVSALPLAAFGLAARWVIPDVFGRDWLPALPVYVLLALWVTLRVPVTVQRTLLYAFGRNVPPAITSAIELAIVTVVSLVAVRELGIVGYGIASVVAVSSTVYTHYSARRLVPLRYRRLVVPLVGLVPPVFVPLLPLPWALLLLLPPLLLVVSPSTRRELGHVLASVRTTILPRGRRVTAPQSPVPVAAVAPAEAPATAPTQAVPVLLAPQGAGVEMALNGTSTQSWDPGAEVDLLAELLAETDPMTGFSTSAALLARLGRVLGAARDSGWTLGLVAVHLVRAGPSPLVGPSEGLLAGVAGALRAELRFDDMIARVGPSTFVAGVALVEGGAEGPEVAARLDVAVRRAVAAADPGLPVGAAALRTHGAAGSAWAARTALLLLALPSAQQADLLVRQVVGAVRG